MTCANHLHCSCWAVPLESVKSFQNPKIIRHQENTYRNAILLFGHSSILGITVPCTGKTKGAFGGAEGAI